MGSERFRNCDGSGAVTDEGLRIVKTIDSDSWHIFYRGYIELPFNDWRLIGDSGQASIFVSEEVNDAANLGAAVRVAKEWAEGSGFIVRSPKIALHGNEVTIKLVRPA